MKRLQQHSRKLVLGVMALQLTGCGYLFGDGGMFRDQSEDYKRAPEMPVISMPEGSRSEALQDIYPIPPAGSGLIAAGEFEVPRPTPLVAGAEDQAVRIQRLGDESWALIDEAPGQVWPQVRGFLASAGINVVRVDASAGIMETDWLSLESAAMSSRFRMRIDQGVQRGTSELHVLQQNRAGDTGNWPTSSDNPDQENEMLQSLAQYIADSAGNAPVSMVAEQAINASGRIALQKEASGEPYIQLLLPFDRAWASLGLALEKSDFEITDRDRSKGIYYLRFLGPEAGEEGGWFDWLWGSDEAYPHVGEAFLASVREVNPAEMAIHLRLQEGEGSIDEGERQALLNLVKGNIN